MKTKPRIIAGPHLCSGESGSRILWTHVGALWLVVVVSAAFFGWSALVVLAGTVLNLFAVPHPTWFAVVALTAIASTVFATGRVAARMITERPTPTA